MSDFKIYSSIVVIASCNRTNYIPAVRHHEFAEHPTNILVLKLHTVFVFDRPRNKAGNAAHLTTSTVFPRPEAAFFAMRSIIVLLFVNK